MSEIEELRERVRELEKERDVAIAAVDANWVTHQRVVTAEAAVASLKEQVEAMRGALERIGDGRFGTTSHARDIAIAALREARNG